MHTRHLWAIRAALLSAPLAIASTFAPAAAGEPISGVAESFSVSRPVSELPTARIDANGQARPRINPLAHEPDGGARGTHDRGDVPPDPLAANSRSVPNRTPGFDLKFSGVGNPLGCGGCLPPDTTGDVGPNHYIQMVNATKVAIYNKSGVLQKPAFNLSTLWPAADPCGGGAPPNNNDAGDPQVLYDELANRWLLSQFQTTNHLCFAISQTPNPLGAYFLYTFSTGSFPDYFKVGVWPNGYYVSANETSYTAYAFNRAKMVAGNPTANFIKFTGESNFLMPADIDGTFSVGGGGLFYTFKDNSFHGGADRIELFRLSPNYAVPASSTFTLINTFPIAAFTYTPCGFFNLDCAEQPSTAEGLDVVGEWPMQRFPFRKITGSRQMLVGNFTIGAAPNGPGGVGEVGSAIRWFELRRPGAGGAWTFFQEGTIDPPDGIDRFMGSIAVDKRGDIAVAYSASNEATFPSIRYVSRRPGDAAGTMGTERIFQAGLGSQTSTSNRWGDYSALSVDPSNDCRFWLTNEYYTATSVSTWSTRIGHFTDPAC